MTLAEIVGSVFIALGGATTLLGAVGVLRFPDFYTRLHAAGKGDTLGQGLILSGLFVVTLFGAHNWNDALKLILVAFFVFIMNSTATHALARAAWIAGLKPWTRKIDESAEEFEQREGQMTAQDRADVILPVQAAPADDAEGGAP